MSFRRAKVYGNGYVGIFARTTNEFTFVGPGMPEKFIEDCSALETEIVETSIAGSHLLGIFVSANSNGAVLPCIAEKDEVQKFKETGLNVYVMKSRYTAVGSNISANDKGAVVNENIPKADLEGIKNCLGVEVFPRKMAGYETVGSSCVATSKGFVANNNASEEEIGELEKMFGVGGTTGTVNMGVSFVGVGLVANSKGYVVSEGTSGFELVRIDEGLGFADQRKTEERETR